jgi:ribosome biogenesis GTPase / thiamine phosphate phosphatase
MDLETNLLRLGWQPSLEQAFRPQHDAGLVPARVAEEHRDRYLLFLADGERDAEITGRLRFTAASRFDLPAVGDWVAAQPSGDTQSFIHAVLPRRSLLLRKVAGELTEPQVLAANVDVLLLVTDADRDFNLRRLERYLTLARESGVQPVIVLNKADLNAAIADLVCETTAAVPGVPVLPISAKEGAGIDALAPWIGEGTTAALIGSSGVGKSTLINRLIGAERLKTFGVREGDGRGRHTTTSRQLILLPHGGIVIDTPGMREVQLWADEESLEAAFGDIEKRSLECRFADCQHEREPGCAIRSALEDGSLDRGRFESYRKLRREVRFLERRQSVRARLEEQARWKSLTRMGRENAKRKYGEL